MSASVPRMIKQLQMSSFGWLHFSDLHQGIDGHGRPWPGIREVLLADLEKMHARSGPWDLVLISGDLTRGGSPAEFAHLDQTLQQLWAHFRALGSNPALVAVPGNHDLVRPDAFRPEFKVIDRWDTYPDVQAEFWRDASSPYRVLIDQAFGPYSDWLKNHPFSGLQLNLGLLPGDFSAVLAKDDFKLGIVGLNSAFLQLRDGNFTGKLALDVCQLHAACAGDGPAWTKECDFALLMTHHPPSWLLPRAREKLLGEIAPPGRFVAHIYGHMREHASKVVAIGGGPVRRELQGTSLFGLEAYGDGAERRHGYTAARIRVNGKNKATLRLWPRVAKKHAAGYWRIVQDLDNFELKDDQGTHPEPLPLRRTMAHKRRSAYFSSASNPARQSPQLPVLVGENKEASTRIATLSKERVIEPGAAWDLRKYEPPIALLRNVIDTRGSSKILNSITGLEHDVAADIRLREHRAQFLSFLTTPPRNLIRVLNAASQALLRKTIDTRALSKDLVLRPRRSDLVEFEDRSGLLLREPPSDLPPAPVSVLVPQGRSTAEFGERADPEAPEAFT